MGLLNNMMRRIQCLLVGGGSLKRKASPVVGLAEVPVLALERQRQLRQSVDVANRWLASSARPDATRALREILQARASARVKGGLDQNSLPGLF